jgi:hypothetical protein
MKLRNFSLLDPDNNIKKYEFTKMKAMQVMHFYYLKEGRLINKLKLLKPESNLNDI